MNGSIRTPRLLALALASALAALSPHPAAAGTGVNSDAYTCLKARDLKIATEVQITPNPTFVGVTQGGSGDCNMHKLSLVCLPSSVNTDVPVNTTVAQCCFRARCDHAIGNLANVAVQDDGGGSGTYSLNAALSHATLTCVPCTFALQ